MAEKLNNFEKFERRRKKKSNFSLFSTQTPDDWPNALDHLTISDRAQTQAQIPSLSLHFHLSLIISLTNLFKISHLSSNRNRNQLCMGVQPYICRVLGKWKVNRKKFALVSSATIVANSSALHKCTIQRPFNRRDARIIVYGNRPHPPVPIAIFRPFLAVFFETCWKEGGYIYNWCQDLSFRRKLRPCKSC